MVKRSPLKCKFLRFSSAPVKFCQIPYVNVKASQFLFRFFIVLQRQHKTPLKILVCAFSTLDKTIQWKYRFWHFQVFWWKLAKFPNWWIAELFLWYGWPSKGVYSYFQPGLLSEILTIANLPHASSRIWTPRRTWVQTLLNEVVQ